MKLRIQHVEVRSQEELTPAASATDNNSLAEGAKHDDGKLRYDLIPAIALEDLAAVYTFGAKKYEDNNWRKGIKWTRVFGAIMRHLWAWMRGEEFDSESGLPHLAHAAWGCFTLLDYSRTQRNFDDRMIPMIVYERDR